MKKRNVLNRFTSLPILLEMLTSRCIALLNPANWEDRNDSYYIEEYRKEKKLLAVLAICFTSGRETYHHWKIYSDGQAGICIEFDKKKVLQQIQNMKDLRWGDVDYKWIKENRKPSPEQWPFLKRKPFEDESEFRIIYESSQGDEKIKKVPVSLKCINKITISPWLHESTFKTVSRIIRSIRGCRRLKINRSTLLENRKWKREITKKEGKPQTSKIETTKNAG